MEEWKEYRLDAICRLSAGGDAPHNAVKKPTADMTVPIYSNGENEKGLYGYTDSHKIEAPAVTISARGNIGYVCYRKENFVPIVRLITAKANEQILSNEFLYYCLCNTHIWGDGSVQKQLTVPMISEYIVRIPPLIIQSKIVHVLKSLDDKIEVNRRINDNFHKAFFEVVLIWLLTSLVNDNLEQQAKALFKSWFVDFEPFRDHPFVESELGMIPKGWRVGTLNELGDVVGGSTPSKAKPEYYTNDGIAWLTPKDLSISQRKFTSKGEIDITHEGYESCSTKLMPKGSVLFSSRAPIGYITIAKNDICTNQGFKSVIPKFAGTAFLYCFLKESTQEIENKATGSTFKEASGALMKSLPAIIPEKAVLDDFENLLSPLFHQQEVVEEENSLLSSLRDSLLPRLMSGELNVSEINM